MKKNKYQFTIETNEKGQVFTKRNAGSETNAYLIMAYLQIEINDILKEIEERRNNEKL